MYRIEGVIRGADLVVSLTRPEGAETPALEIEIGAAAEDAPARRLPCPLTPGEDDRLTGRVPVPDALAGASGIGWHLTVGGTAVPAEEVDAGGWQVGILRIPDRSIYNRVMRYTFQRVEDAETLMWIAHVTAHAEEVEPRIRMTSFVVCCYRALELDRVDMLEAVLPLFDTFAAQYDEIAARYTTGSVREVGEQVALSVLSVQWHVLIRLGRHAEAVAVLRTILARGRDNPQYHALPFAMNYANAGLLLAYLHYRRGLTAAAPDPVRDVYAQFRGMLAALPEEIPAYNHLKEFEIVAAKMALAADLEWLMRPHVRAALADGSAEKAMRVRQSFADRSYDAARLMRMCARQTEGAALQAAFARFCAEADPRG